MNRLRLIGNGPVDVSTCTSSVPIPRLDVNGYDAALGASSYPGGSPETVPVGT